MRERAQSETERIIGRHRPPKSGSKVVQQLQDRQRTREKVVFYVCCAFSSVSERLIIDEAVLSESAHQSTPRAFKGAIHSKNTSLNNSLAIKVRENDGFNPKILFFFHSGMFLAVKLKYVDAKTQYLVLPQVIAPLLTHCEI